MAQGKLAGPIIGAAGVVVAAVIAVVWGGGGGGGGGGEKTTVVYVPGQPPPTNATVPAQPAQPTGTAPATPAAQPSARPQPATDVAFTVYDDLDDGQLGVRVVVYIENENKGTLLIDASKGEAQGTLKVRVPRAGTYGYRIDVGAAFQDEVGNVLNVEHSGSGRITVASGDVFFVAFENGVLSLRKR